MVLSYFLLLFIFCTSLLAHQVQSDYNYYVVSFKRHDIGLWHILAAITLLIFIIKQPFNFFALKVSCQKIAAIDYSKRAKMGINY